MRYYSEISDMLFTDQLNNTIELDSYPNRIVSLVPSQTELLWDLGLRHELVGITKFCIHPKELFNTVKRVGGTKTLDLDIIRNLKPDLIIGNKEENELSQMTQLQKEFKVWMSDIYTLQDALQMIRSIGEVVNCKNASYLLAKDIEQSFVELEPVHKRALYLIWKPYMAAGRSTFIGDLMQRMGLENVLEDPKGRYPKINIDDIKSLNPDIVLLSSEPFPFKEEHLKELKQYLPLAKILLVDGELFSWYGSRLRKSVDYFNHLPL
jgi:ABC-type Fe3+-hydroxamate transport system substrate-binding protein